MIGNTKKVIITRGGYVLSITISDIEKYLVDVKKAIQKNRYRIEMNSHRPDNTELFVKYVIDETLVKSILLWLTPMDFSEIRQNEHVGYEHEKLYVFGKDVELLERIGSSYRMVSLYIKFNKLENCYVIVVSLHEQKYPMKYYFK